MWHSLKPCKLFGCSTARTYVLSVLQVELWVVKLIATFELCCILFFRVRKVELDSKRIVFNFVAIPLLQVPEGLLLIAVEDVLSHQVQDLAIVILHSIHLQLSSFFLDLSPSLCVITDFVASFLAGFF